MKIGFVQLITFVVALLGIFYLLAKPPGFYTVWQLQGVNDRHMMSYVISDSDRNLFVVDGGRKEDAGNLKAFLQKKGGEVTGWFITHPHDDHVGALTALLNEGLDGTSGLKIQTIYGSFLEESLMETCHRNRVINYRELKSALDRSKVHFVNTSSGMIFGNTKMKIEVLTDISPEITNNCMNNSSIVYRFSDDKKSVLFLGDLGVQAGNKLLKGPFKEKLKSDYVQMAHHGQRGVGLNVYKKIGPTGCLWPTPKWLWENDNGKGYNTGPWDTIRVRQWMEKLGVTKHFVMADGLQEIN